jgi:hypothetical protein
MAVLVRCSTLRVSSCFYCDIRAWVLICFLQLLQGLQKWDLLFFLCAHKLKRNYRTSQIIQKLKVVNHKTNSKAFSYDLSISNRWNWLLVWSACSPEIESKKRFLCRIFGLYHEDVAITIKIRTGKNHLSYLRCPG